jgi:hypothetical protein
MAMFFFYAGRTYTSTASGSKTKIVTCESCRNSFKYEVRGTATGSGHSVYYFDNKGAAERAREKALQDLQASLENRVGIVHCPTCGIFQKNMLPLIRSSEMLDYNAHAALRVQKSESDLLRETKKAGTIDAYLKFECLAPWPRTCGSQPASRSETIGNPTCRVEGRPRTSHRQGSGSAGCMRHRRRLSRRRVPANQGFGDSHGGEIADLDSIGCGIDLVDSERFASSGRTALLARIWGTFPADRSGCLAYTARNCSSSPSRISLALDADRPRSFAHASVGEGEQQGATQHFSSELERSLHSGDSARDRRLRAQARESVQPTGAGSFLRSIGIPLQRKSTAWQICHPWCPWSSTKGRRRPLRG